MERKLKKALRKLDDIVGLLSEVDNSLTLALRCIENEEVFPVKDYNEAMRMAVKADSLAADMGGIAETMDSSEERSLLLDFASAVKGMTIPDDEVVSFQIDQLSMAAMSVSSVLEQGRELLDNFSEEKPDVPNVFRADGS